MGNVLALLICAGAFVFSSILFNIGWAMIGLVASLGAALLLRTLDPVEIEPADMLWVAAGAMILWILVAAILQV